MRFAVPAQAASELKALQNAGAVEIYLGFMDAEWRRVYGGHDSISRRQGAANLSDYKELEALAGKAVDLSMPAYLTLNARCSDEQIPILLELAKRWEKMGGTGVIVREPFLMEAIRDAVPKLRITASLLSVMINSGALRLLQEIGVERVVLPRFLKVEEMTALRALAPQMEFEAMVMGDRCPYIDGFCRSIHGETFCPAQGKISLPGIRTFDTSGQAHHLCMSVRCAMQDPCAACMLSVFRDSDIIGKLGGRGTPLEQRIGWLEFLREAEKMKEKEQIQESYQARFGHPCSCYYGEINENS